jgi:hypothetical protein
MSRLRQLLTRIDGFFFAEQPIHAMVICRVAFGAILFCAYATRIGEVQLLYGPDGMSGAGMHTRAPANWPHGERFEEAFQWLHLITSETAIWFVFATLLVCSLSFAVGFKTRITGSIALGLHWLMCAHNPVISLGWSYMIKPYMAYVIMSRAGDYFSIDASIMRRRGLPVPQSTGVPGVPLRLLQIHVCTMYAVAGWSRLIVPSWYQGDMLLVALNWEWFSRFHYDWVSIRHVLKPLALGAFIVEPLAPLLLWIPWSRTWWALALIGMHVTLEVTANVGWWQFMMTAALTTFLPNAWIVSAIDWGQIRFRKIAGS